MLAALLETLDIGGNVFGKKRPYVFGKKRQYLEVSHYYWHRRVEGRRINEFFKAQQDVRKSLLY